MSNTTNEVTVLVKEAWHSNPSGRYAMSLQADGITVRVQQRRAGGAYYRVFGYPENSRSLETSDRDEAQRRAEAFLKALASARRAEGATAQAVASAALGLVPRTAGTAAAPAASAGPTLGQIFNLYLGSATFDKNKHHTKAGDLSRARIILAGLGEDTPASHLSHDMLNAYLERRRSGLHYRRPNSGLLSGVAECKAKPAGDRTLEADVRLLKTAVTWAAKKHKVDGQALLAEDALADYTLESHSDKNAKRPVANLERFRLTMLALHQLALEAPSEEARRLWVLTALALVLVESTGRRISAVLHLRWRDFDAVMDDTSIPAIHWARQFDKKRRTRKSPTPAIVADQLAAFKGRLGATDAEPDAWVFAQANDPRRPCTQGQLAEKLLEAEQRAGLPKLDGGVWHPYRRKWATERKHLPVKDVMEAGGWEDYGTYLNSYSQGDPHTQLAVVNHPARLHGDGEVRAPEPGARRDPTSRGRRRPTPPGGLRLVS